MNQRTERTHWDDEPDEGYARGIPQRDGACPEGSWVITEHDALDVLTIALLPQPHLDGAVRIPRSHER